MSKELKLDLFNIYDVVVFEDETGIVQDCVCAILKDSVEPEIAGVVQCNIYSISIYNDGYKVWERDGKDLPYYTTNKKIIHLYTLKNDNRFYEIYPTNDYESYMSFDKAGSREALECLEALQSIRDKYSMPLTEYVNSFDYIKIIKQVLLKAQFLEEEYNNLMEDKDNLESELFKQQEPKQYLKWEDLEFKKKQQVMDVLLNGKPYILYFYKLATQTEVNMFAIDMHIVTLNSYYPEDVQFFNDLHLERVEE